MKCRTVSDQLERGIRLPSFRFKYASLDDRIKYDELTNKGPGTPSPVPVLKELIG